MMSEMAKLIVFAVIALLLIGCKPQLEGSSAEEPLLVFAAASLRDVLTTLQPRFEKESGATLAYNFAGSNVLAQQIAAAPRADVYLSANEAWMDFLADRDLLTPGSRRAWIANQLVVIAPTSVSWTLNTLGDLKRLPFRFLSLADPEAVPAGIYSRQALERAGGTWSEVEGRVVPAVDVRAALALVAAREDTVGMVYRSDLIAEPGRVRVLLHVPPELTPEIRYSMAALRGSRHPQTLRFLDFLRGEEVREVYRRLGFQPVEDMKVEDMKVEDMKEEPRDHG